MQYLIFPVLFDFYPYVLVSFFSNVHFTEIDFTGWTFGIREADQFIWTAGLVPRIGRNNGCSNNRYIREDNREVWRHVLHGGFGTTVFWNIMLPSWDY